MDEKKMFVTEISQRLSTALLFSSFPARVYSLLVSLHRLAAAKLNMETALEDAEYMAEELERWKKERFDIDKKQWIHAQSNLTVWVYVNLGPSVRGS